jgi:DNA-binding MarR family transcriptional regulator
MNVVEDKQETDGPAVFGQPLHQYLTYRLSRVQAKLNAQSARLLRQTVGLTLTQWRIVALVGAAGTTRLSDITRETALDKGLLSRNLKSLVTDGVMITKQDSHDNRVQWLSLSPKGRDVRDHALPVTRSRQAWLREALTKEELRTFQRVVDKLEIAAERREF